MVFVEVLTAIPTAAKSAARKPTFTNISCAIKGHLHRNFPQK